MHCSCCLCLFQTSCLSDINYRSLLQEHGCLHCSSLHLLKISRLDGSSDRICYGALVAYLAAALFGACRNIYISSVQYEIKIVNIKLLIFQLIAAVIAYFVPTAALLPAFGRLFSCSSRLFGKIHTGCPVCMYGHLNSIYLGRL